MVTSPADQDTLFAIDSTVMIDTQPHTNRASHSIPAFVSVSPSTINLL